MKNEIKKNMKMHILHLFTLIFFLITIRISITYLNQKQNNFK